ncbi:MULTISPECIES: GNAT family N-acetyltransferase [unclassified Sphingomonas]|jgi:diamine N-acetyltransferase|uniref:GNAT family N-acetyltransferase n=1 Tax=unclassified Sphingomonas TaxID=196159 RepID=UPI000E10CE64|nr:MULTISPECIES: GNAT family N-acetyltransferase [unclassified Sphingomonas]AXJ95527.1 GNAT family N-acetyltransferase [Sphingomonas sp. FARSPH]
MTATLRPATRDDAPAIAALMRDSFTATFGHLYAPADLAAFLDGLTLARWQAEIADPAFAFLLAEAEGRLLGFAKLGPHSLPVTPTGPMIELRQLYLADAAQGTGLAQRMMDWAIATARERGAAEVFLSVYVDNDRARRFYERYGFVRVGRYDFMVGNHRDEDDLMRLAL